MNNLINNSYRMTLEYYKLKCKCLESENKWLDELANYERDANRYEATEEDEEWRKEIDKLYLDCRKLQKKLTEWEQEYKN